MSMDFSRMIGHLAQKLEHGLSRVSRLGEIIPNLDFFEFHRGLFRFQSDWRYHLSHRESNFSPKNPTFWENLHPQTLQGDLSWNLSVTWCLNHLANLAGYKRKMQTDHTQGTCRTYSCSFDLAECKLHQTSSKIFLTWLNMWLYCDCLCSFVIG